MTRDEIKSYKRKVAKITTNKIMVVNGRGQVQGELETNIAEWKKRWAASIQWQSDFKVKKF